MIGPPAGARILLATRPVDFRKGAHGLAALAAEMLGEDPFSCAVLVFRSRRADRVKILVWDGSGLVLVWKQLEGGAFRWPPVVDGVLRLTPVEFAALFDGIDCRRVQTLREIPGPSVPALESAARCALREPTRRHCRRMPRAYASCCSRRWHGATRSAPSLGASPPSATRWRSGTSGCITCC